MPSRRRGLATSLERNLWQRTRVIVSAAFILVRSIDSTSMSALVPFHSEFGIAGLRDCTPCGRGSGMLDDAWSPATAHSARHTLTARPFSAQLPSTNHIGTPNIPHHARARGIGVASGALHAHHGTIKYARDSCGFHSRTESCDPQRYTAPSIAKQYASGLVIRNTHFGSQSCDPQHGAEQ